MRLEIAPGVGIHISDPEHLILQRMRQGQLRDQDSMTESELALVLRLVNKNVLKRRSNDGKVSYEIRPTITV